MSALQIHLFMQNKAKFQKVKLNVNKVLTRNYEQMDTWLIRKNKPKTNPIQSQFKPNTKPKRTQFKAKQTQSVLGLSNLFQKAHLLMDRAKSKLLNFQIKFSLTGLRNSVKYWVLYCERDFL
jgi:hypothetical protein